MKTQPPSPDLPGDLITAAEAAALLPGRGGRRLHVSAVYRLIRAGRLPAWRLRGEYRVSRRDVLAMLVPVPVRREAPQPTRAQVRRETQEVLQRHGLM